MVEPIAHTLGVLPVDARWCGSGRGHSKVGTAEGRPLGHRRVFRDRSGPRSGVVVRKGRPPHLCRAQSRGELRLAGCFNSDRAGCTRITAGIGPFRNARTDEGLPLAPDRAFRRDHCRCRAAPALCEGRPQTVFRPPAGQRLSVACDCDRSRLAPPRPVGVARSQFHRCRLAATGFSRADVRGGWTAAGLPDGVSRHRRCTDSYAEHDGVRLDSSGTCTSTSSGLFVGRTRLRYPTVWRIGPRLRSGQQPTVRDPRVRRIRSHHPFELLHHLAFHQWFLAWNTR